MTFFFAELGLMNYSTIIKYSPSKLSASAVYAARCTLNRSPLWTETLKHYTGYSEDQLMYASNFTFYISRFFDCKLRKKYLCCEFAMIDDYQGVCEAVGWFSLRSCRKQAQGS